MITHIRFAGFTEKQQNVAVGAMAVVLLALLLSRPIAFLTMLVWGAIQDAF